MEMGTGFTVTLQGGNQMHGNSVGMGTLAVVVWATCRCTFLCKVDKSEVSQCKNDCM